MREFMGMTLGPFLKKTFTNYDSSDSIRPSLTTRRIIMISWGYYAIIILTGVAILFWLRLLQEGSEKIDLVSGMYIIGWPITVLLWLYGKVLAKMNAGYKGES